MDSNITEPVFIIGVPRSGTTLLRVILDSHSEIAGAPETGWLSGGYTDFSIRKLVEELIQNKLGATKNLTGVTPDAVKLAARQFLNVLFKEYLAARGKKYLVLKTPDDAGHIDFIVDLFPNSKFIHIYRDGRDVACSTVAQKNKFFGEDMTGFGELNLFNALDRWQKWESNIRIYLQHFNSISIRYEELVTNPLFTVEQVISFLELPMEKGMIEYASHNHEYPEWEAGSTDVKIIQDIQQGRIGRWKKEIPPEKWIALDNRFGRFLKEWGFKTCRDTIKEDSEILIHIDTKKYDDAIEFFEKEITYKNQLINNYELKVNEAQNEILQNDKMISYMNSKIESLLSHKNQSEKTISELNNSLTQKDRIIGSLKNELNNQISRKTSTINLLQTKLQSQDDLIYRIIEGKSFRIGRLVTAPSRIISKGKVEDDEVSNIYKRKKRSVNLGDQLHAGFGNHRSGWAFAITCLAPINRPESIYLDTFIERTFVWKPGEIIPTLKPWVGFIHVPPNVPDWFQYEQSNDAIFQTKAWQESFPYCRGLFTLSNYHKKSLEKKLNIPINSLFHPTEFPSNTWRFEKFILNPERKIVQIGWWLRKLHAIFELPHSDYQKVFLRVSNEAYFNKIFNLEYQHRKKAGLFHSSMYNTAKTIAYLNNNEYDRLLSENIAFADLYDSSANNLVIECIARNTPLLINPLEPVVEYLGKDYPFYFTSYEEAIDKAQDLDLIEKTHNYLKTNEIRQKLTGEYFLQSFINSEILNTCQ
ncbi:MAG: sulfotransferase family protein [Desulfobulbaceae bacterium]